MTREQARALDAADPLAHLRARFRLPDESVYLDGNSLGALPKDAAARMADVVERQWGTDLITSWNEHGWIEWPLSVAAKLAPIVGGKGGGKPDLAQAGGKDADRLNEAIEMARTAVGEILGHTA